MGIAKFKNHINKTFTDVATLMSFVIIQFYILVYICKLYQGSRHFYVSLMFISHVHHNYLYFSTMKPNIVEMDIKLRTSAQETAVRLPTEPQPTPVYL